MSSGLLLLVLAIGLAVSPGHPGPPPHRPGRIVALDPAHRTLTLDEMGLGPGPSTRLLRRVLQIAPDTAIVLVHRAGGSGDPRCRPRHSASVIA